MTCVQALGSLAPLFRPCRAMDLEKAAEKEINKRMDSNTPMQNALLHATKAAAPEEPLRIPYGPWLPKKPPPPLPPTSLSNTKFMCFPKPPVCPNEAKAPPRSMHHEEALIGARTVVINQHLFDHLVKHHNMSEEVANELIREANEVGLELHMTAENAVDYVEGMIDKAAKDEAKNSFTRKLSEKGHLTMSEREANEALKDAVEASEARAKQSVQAAEFSSLCRRPLKDDIEIHPMFAEQQANEEANEVTPLFKDLKARCEDPFVRSLAKLAWAEGKRHITSEQKGTHMVARHNTSEHEVLAARDEAKNAPPRKLSGEPYLVNHQHLIDELSMSLPESNTVVKDAVEAVEDFEDEDIHRILVARLRHNLSEQQANEVANELTPICKDSMVRAPWMKFGIKDFEEAADAWRHKYESDSVSCAGVVEDPRSFKQQMAQFNQESQAYNVPTKGHFYFLCLALL